MPSLKSKMALVGLLLVGGLFAFLVPVVPPPPCADNASCAAPPHLRSVGYALLGVGSVVDEFGRYAILGLPVPVVIGTTTSQTFQGGTSTVSWCVEAGEPLYPATMLVPLGNFTAEWGSHYQIQVSYLNEIVVVSGSGVGSSSLKSVSFILTSC